MSCEDMHDLLHAYLDGELDLVRAVAMEQHLQACHACAQAYTQQRALRSAVQASALYYAAPESLQRRLQSALRTASTPAAKPSLFPWRWWSAAAAVALVVFMTWRLAAVLTGPAPDNFLIQELISSHVRALMVDHMTDVASTDQHTVKPWFEGKLDFSPPVYTLTEQGFALVGARLDYLANRPVAALVYQRQQHAINLFIWPATPAAPRTAAAVTRQGYNLTHWATADLTYWAISNLNQRELWEFVRLLQHQQALTASP
jgi:mycothiol system anti-sigma-R factor